MKHQLPPLDGLKVFESAARHLSFSLAAKELCITKGAVSYQIRKLEASLDCALFRRSVRQVYLTEAGQLLLQTTQKLFTELSQTFTQIKPHDATHSVTVGVTTYVALRWLSMRISEFNQLHPNISILLQHSVNVADFSVQDVDFAIRWCAMTGKTSSSRRLELPMPLFPVCSPELLMRHGYRGDAVNVATVQLCDGALSTTPLLCEDRSLDVWQLWYAPAKRELTNPRRVIADANVRTQAAIDGQGWTMADALMERELTSGALVAPFDNQLSGYGYAIESSTHRYLNRDAVVLRDWLIERETTTRLPQPKFVIGSV